MADGKWLQKIFALVFLSAYVILTGCMIVLVYKIAVNETPFPEWAIAFISTIWGGMSTKLGTIMDYLFGSSQSSSDKNEILENSNSK